MIKRALAGLACAAAAAVILAGCGGSGSDPSTVVARIGAYKVTRGLLNEWMTEKVGEDFYTVAGHQVPAKLVSEPADYPACIAALKTIISPHHLPSVAVLMRKCKEMRRELKEQALEYLVSSFWSFNFYAKYGIRVSDARAHRALERFNASLYPKPGEFQQTLTSRRRTLTQDLLIIKNDVLASDVKERLLSRGAQTVSALRATFERELHVHGAACSPGYVVLYCRGYTASSAPRGAHSAAVLMEEIAG